MHPKILFILSFNFIMFQTGFAFEWDEDMRDQPSIKAQESQVNTNPGSIPQSGKETILPPADMSELVQARLAAGDLENPIAKSGESLNRGKVVYDIHCATCHGAQGHGDGKVGKKYVPDPMNLTIDYVQLQPDGQLFYTISHGSIAMPYYRDVIPIADRWHIVNYIKY
ncbi:MAG: c-type cytochrome, partial [Proteobacteria bacterium]|nr:c-type cytochrome [Pseudomonadota bacterium]